MKRGVRGSVSAHARANESVAEKVLEVARRRGFLWQSCEIYGGVSGFYDFGPLGTLLKRNVENAWRRFYIKEGFYEIETSCIAPRAVFEASRHLECFADELVRCERCGAFFKRENLERCPECNGTLRFEGTFNLMFQTHIGVMREADATRAAGTAEAASKSERGEAYLRPETAQGIFVDFVRLLKFNRDKLPFGIFQIGKAFRNEISPRQSLIRLREFTLAEAEVFVLPEEKNKHPRFHEVVDRMLKLVPSSEEGASKASVVSEASEVSGVSEASEASAEEGEELSVSVGDAVRNGIISSEYLAYHIARVQEFLESVGIPKHRLRFRQHHKEEMAHYAVDCWDAEFWSEKYGWMEIVGIADRGDFDLTAHSTASNVSMAVRNDRGEKVIPHVIEPSYGIDRIIYAILESAFHEEVVSPAKEEKRRVLRFKKEIAPVRAAVFPLLNREELKRKAEEVFNMLREEMQKQGAIVVYDDSGSIGRRYRRQDEIGTPFCITIDYETLENDTVTVETGILCSRSVFT